MEQKNPATPLSPQLKESKARGGCCENIFKNIRNGPPLNPSPPEEEVSSSMIDLCWRNCPFRRAAIFVYPPSDSWPSAQMFQWLLDEFAVFNSLNRLLFWFVIDQLTDRRVKFLKMRIFNRALARIDSRFIWNCYQLTARAQIDALFTELLTLGLTAGHILA